MRKKTKTRGSFRCSDGGEANPKMTVVSEILVTKRGQADFCSKIGLKELDYRVTRCCGPLGPGVVQGTGL